MFLEGDPHAMTSDSDLRQALLGTWRLIRIETQVNGRVVKPYGEDPLGYLVYTTDGHVFVQFAARTRPRLFRPTPHGNALLETTEANTILGFKAYSGTFEVRDGQVLHHTEFDIVPDLDGRVEARAAILNGDRLILGTPAGWQLEWRRVHVQ
jgi:hypothetical protein